MGFFDFIFGKRIIAENDNEWAFLKSAKDGNIDGIKMGILKKVNINIRNNIGQTALYLAACYHHFTICEYLINKGADPYIADSEGTTAFDWAKIRGSDYPEVLELFEKKFGKRKN